MREIFGLLPARCLMGETSKARTTSDITFPACLLQSVEMLFRDDLDMGIVDCSRERCGLAQGREVTPHGCAQRETAVVFVALQNLRHRTSRNYVGVDLNHKRMLCQVEQMQQTLPAPAAGTAPSADLRDIDDRGRTKMSIENFD